MKWRAFGKSHSSIRCVVSHHGGFVPALRQRSLLALTLTEREEISRRIASGSSIRELAKLLERAASTVSRKVARHGGRPEYRAKEADDQAWESALRAKRCLLAMQVKLQQIVASKLILDWSPEQVSGWLKIQYPDDKSMRVSHETIYRSLFIQARGVLKKSCLDTCAPSAAYAARSTLVSADSRAVKSSRPSPSEKDRQKSRTTLFPVIGKAIWRGQPDGVGHPRATRDGLANKIRNQPSLAGLRAPWDSGKPKL